VDTLYTLIFFGIDFLSMRLLSNNGSNGCLRKHLHGDWE